MLSFPHHKAILAEKHESVIIYLTYLAYLDW
jgi:hypothetical protein